MASTPEAALLSCSPHLRLVHDFRTGPGMRLPPRRICDHALLFFAAGSGEARIGGEWRTIVPGLLMALAPGTEHEFALSPGTRAHMLNIHFDPRWRKDSERTHYADDHRLRFARLPRGDDRVLPASWGEGAFHVVGDAGVFAGLFRRLHAAFPAVGAAAGLRLKAAMLDLLAWLHADAAPRGALPEELAARMDALRAWIDRHLDRRIAIADLAREAKLARTALIAAYVARFGEPPASHLRRLRIERAKALLAGEGLTPREAAERTGFANVHHFTRCFARLVGAPPSTWARGLRGRE